MKSSGWITFSTPGPGSDWVRQAFLEGKGETMKAEYVVPEGMLNKLRPIYMELGGERAGE